MIMCRRLKYSSLGSSPRNSLQIGYTNLSINGTPAYKPVVAFSHSVVPSPIIGKKVELFLSVPWRYMEGAEVKYHSFLASALYGSESLN
jgi:hypothetical protein